MTPGRAGFGLAVPLDLGVGLGTVVNLLVRQIRLSPPLGEELEGVGLILEPVTVGLQGLSARPRGRGSGSEAAADA